MFSLSASVLTIALGLVYQVTAQFPLPVLYSDGLSPHVDATLINVTPANITSFISRAWGTLPEACLNAVHDEHLYGWDVEVYEVTYSDCPSQPWVFCRHHAAQLSQTQMAGLFGRLPLRERELVRHVMAFPQDGCSAYATGTDVAFQGLCNTVSIWQHEVGHVVDLNLHNGVRSSGTPTFLNAVANDTCVPDDYSNSSEIEDYTQVSVLVLYDIVAAGGLNSTGTNWSCLKNQKAAVDTLQRDAMVYGGTCTRRVPDSPSVPVSQRGRSVRRAAKDPKEYRTPTTVFKNLVHGLD